MSNPSSVLLNGGGRAGHGGPVADAAPQLQLFSGD